MVHQLITIAEEVGPDDTVWSVFDRKLEIALQAVEVAASVRLRSEMGHSIELIRWLEGWNLRFKQQGKSMFCIAEDPAQQQCLELSHPNMGLISISSLNDIPKMLLRLTQQKKRIEVPPVMQAVRSEVAEKKEPPPPSAPMRQPLPASAALPLPPAIAAPAPVSPQQPPVNAGLQMHQKQEMPGMVAAPPPAGAATAVNTSRTAVIGNVYSMQQKSLKQVRQNDIIEIAGEYRCDNCGTTRMFCKGSAVDTCENRECYAPRASYTLLFDLF